MLVSPSDWRGSTVTIVTTSTSAGPSGYRAVAEICGRETRLLIDRIRTIDTDYVKGWVDNLGRDSMTELDHALARYLQIS